MKLKHSELEEFKKSPLSFKNRKKVEFGARKFSYISALKLSMFYLHTNHDNILDAHLYLQTLCDKHFSNIKKVNELHAKLDDYYREFKLLNHIAFSTRYRLDSSICDDLIIGGEISRIDTNVNSIGYYAYLFVNGGDCWENQFRIPIIQHCLAQKLNCPVNEIEVGVFDLKTFTHESICVSNSDIIDAISDLKKLYRTLAE